MGKHIVDHILFGAAYYDEYMPQGTDRIETDMRMMDAAGIIAGEKVQIVDNNNGERLETYVIEGPAGSGCICINGAAARKVAVGDIVIIISYGIMDFEEAKTFRPSVVFPDTATNRLIR